MKVVIFLVIIFSVAIALASETINKNPNLQKLQQVVGHRRIAGLTISRAHPVGPFNPSLAAVKAPKAPGEYCATCVDFMVQAINELLNIILNGGVLGSCSALCALLPNDVEAEVCDVLCTIAGIEAFIKLINVTDPDPLWICMELDQTCPINDNAKANITSLVVKPPSAPAGSNFTIEMIWKVTNTIGTGEVEFVVIPPDAMPFGDGGLIVWQTPGIYGGELDFSAEASENEPFNAGTYYVQGALCEGSCGSIHDHSFTLDVKVTKFQITS